MPPNAAPIAYSTPQPAGPCARTATAIADASDAADLRPHEHRQHAERPADERTEEVADAPGEAGAEGEQERRQSTLRVAATASS